MKRLFSPWLLSMDSEEVNGDKNSRLFYLRFFLIFKTILPWAIQNYSKSLYFILL
jgi:hypothetical protein